MVQATTQIQKDISLLLPIKIHSIDMSHAYKNYKDINSRLKVK